MSSTDPFPLKFDRATITSAQRLRMIKSSRPLFIVVIVVLFSISSIWDKLLPWLQGKTPAPTELYATLYGLGLALVVLVAIYLFLPMIDPWINRWWQRDFQLALQPEAVHLIGPGGATLDVEWSKVKRVLRNEQAIVLIFGRDSRDFLILPRESIRQAGREALLDQYLETAAKAKSEGRKREG
ncbi:hypothetical protein LARV_03784 [Longilinea arvoryzae]|uniref:YcxB-like protein domain-containing protein n=1 Tax=Longilinea arvoryzae TaxID=360412 RepID=A0A0K8MXL6_9CHLR|nr:YcxB family protein [Longilinea arvoryzae]GAP15989.1 hypothetical protein LARV_03784 [Longilinea arvoryzae]